MICLFSFLRGYAQARYASSGKITGFQMLGCYVIMSPRKHRSYSSLNRTNHCIEALPIVLPSDEISRTNETHRKQTIHQIQFAPLPTSTQLKETVAQDIYTYLHLHQTKFLRCGHTVMNIFICSQTFKSFNTPPIWNEDLQTFCKL